METGRVSGGMMRKQRKGLPIQWLIACAIVICVLAMLSIVMVQGYRGGTAALVVRQQPDAVFGGWGNLVRAQPAAARIRTDRCAHTDCHPGLGAVARGPGAAAASDRMGCRTCAGSADARLGAGTAAGTVDPPVGRLGRGVGGFPILRHTADAFLCSGSQ